MESDPTDGFLVFLNTERHTKIHVWNRKVFGIREEITSVECLVAVFLRQTTETQVA